jgi:tRNA (guanosine-2'-O-)-methyltransferase
MSQPSAFFPLPGRVRVGAQTYAPADVLRVLEPFVSAPRRARIDAVVAARTFRVVPVLEGLVDPGNVNAVLRSAEGLGYGAAHLVGLEGDAARMAEHYLTGDPDAATVRDRRAAHRTSQGAHKWVELAAFDDRAAYLAHVRAQGYRVAVTALRDDASPIDAWDFSEPTVLVLGNEHAGASASLVDAADGALLLPLDGFVQSYNVSVAAALALAHARSDRLRRTGRHGDLSEAERFVLTAHYVARGVPLAERILGASGAGEDA